MNVNKQFINLIGAVVIIAVVVAGVALIALPMWSQARTTDASTRTVAQTNAVYQAQIDQLTAAEARLDEIDADLAQLRTQIASFTRLDEVFELIVDAAQDEDVVLANVTAAEPEPFAPRGSQSEEAPAPATGDAAAAADETPTPAPEATTPSAATPDAENTPQQQVLITIDGLSPDAQTAAAFVDALRVGPRLISIIDATLEPGEGKLTVTALAFIRTED